MALVDIHFILFASFIRFLPWAYSPPSHVMEIKHTTWCAVFKGVEILQITTHSPTTAQQSHILFLEYEMQANLDNVLSDKSIIIPFFYIFTCLLYLLKHALTEVYVSLVCGV